jgi:hypothetical protein
MTVSFHKYTGDFFPGTGKLDDNGRGLGKYFSINVPLLDGIDDDMYLTIFKSVIGDTVNAFRPSSIVLQCGADSLGCDRLGAFNLSIAAHGECVNFVRSFNVPLLVLGGGGYTIKNVSRCWTYETAVLVGAGIPDELPATVYDPFFEDSHWKLHPPLTGKIENLNSPASLQRITINIRNKLRYLQGAPSVVMQEIPPDLQGLLMDENRTAEERGEERGAAAADERKQDPHTFANEFYDGEHDVDDDDRPVPSSAKGKGVSSNRRARPARRARGKGKNKRISGEDGDEVSDDSASAVPTRTAVKSRKRAKGRARGRTKTTEKEKDKESKPDVEETAGVAEAAPDEQLGMKEPEELEDTERFDIQACIRFFEEIMRDHSIDPDADSDSDSDS